MQDPAGSIFFVQAINLMSRYIGNSIQKTSATNRFWTVLGTAVRCAQSVSYSSYSANESWASIATARSGAWSPRWLSCAAACSGRQVAAKAGC